MRENPKRNPSISSEKKSGQGRTFRRVPRQQPGNGQNREPSSEQGHTLPAFEKSCGALVIRRDPETGQRFILMIRHRFGGYRSFPKGHTEPGETERETAAREVLEETAAHITFIPDFRQVVLYHPMPGTVKQVVYFLAQTDSEAIAPREGEIATVEWIPLEESMNLLAHDNDRRILTEALHKLDRMQGEKAES